MLPDENDLFLKEVSGKPELKNELESVSAIWKEIGLQLKLEEGPESMDREELIAEILAEHDVWVYGEKKETKKELAFKKNLQQAMSNAEKIEKPKKRILPKFNAFNSLIAAAATIAMVFFLLPNPDLVELTESYYQPMSDPIFETINNASRSGMPSAMEFFKRGSYEEAKTIALSEMEKYPDVIEIQLQLLKLSLKKSQTIH